ncbi:MAG: lamin tail domain-containing protein [Cyclobacteriaceae bacterium]|nr:MAG: lamin tail domain-containing protein [Cyclobacteriaceae bacterium]
MSRIRLLLIKTLLLQASVALYYPVYAQLSDNFSDGDFTNNPEWTGTVSQFIVNTNGQLQLNNPGQATTSFLSAGSPSPTLNGYEWQFFIRLAFAPSGNNFARVYLVSDQSDVAGSLNGYFLQFGEAGSADAIELFRQTGANTVSVCRASTSGGIASAFTVRVRVLRSEAGHWQLFVDYAGGSDFVLEASGTDNTYSTSSFLGLRCTYTSGNSTNFYFDDFYMGPEIMDENPPEIQSVQSISSTELNVFFNERLESNTAQDPSNYFVNNDVGQATNVVLQTDEKTVHLSFAQPFPNAITSQLTVTNVQDLAGNAIVSAQANFFFFQQPPIEYKDIIFTEIFPDPTPLIGLPEAEFVELFNRSNKPISLQGWKFSDASSTATLPAHILMPGDYVIVTPTASSPAFAAYGTVIGISGFPTLNNSSDNLKLRDATDMLIDEVNYTDAWYKDDDKRQGGWTLELIDPENICAEEENWVASEHASGGTPGTENSVKASKPDLTGPRLLSAIPVSATQLKLRFDEKLNEVLPPPSAFVISPTLTVSQVNFANSSLRELLLELESSIQLQQRYVVTITSIYDCSGNHIQEDHREVSFGFPEPAEAGDVVINEVLFNPRPFGVDFLELFNYSEKYINLKNWSVGYFESGNAVNLRTITTADFLLPPKAFIALTVDPFTIQSHYPHAEELLKVEALPSFPDNEGTVSLVSEGAELLDSFFYTDDYHSTLLRDKEGVSLERIHADRLTNDPNNWKSAASVVGYATPGYRNSNSIEIVTTTGKVNIEPEIFIPVFGQPDFTEIRYSFEQGGKVANLKILDHQGREVKQLANNETLATEGFFRWDGERDDGTRARPGYYVVWLEVFDGNGNVDTYRKRVVIAARY